MTNNVTNAHDIYPFVTYTYLTYQQPPKFHPKLPFNSSPSSNSLNPICLSYIASTFSNIAIFTGAGFPQHVAWKITVSSTRCGLTHLLPKLSGCRYATRNFFTGTAEDAPRGRRRFKTICSLNSGCLDTQISFEQIHVHLVYTELINVKEFSFSWACHELASQKQEVSYSSETCRIFWAAIFFLGILGFFQTTAEVWIIIEEAKSCSLNPVTNHHRHLPPPITFFAVGVVANGSQMDFEGETEL